MPRRVLDQYETPPHYVQPLLTLIGPLTGLRVYEPCVGQGHISRYLTDVGDLRTNDIDPACPADTHLDARTPEAWQDGPSIHKPWDWTITNPPFSDALAILAHALANSRHVAILARLSFLEPTRSRATFWRQHPPTDLIVLPRYSFRRNDLNRLQTDSVTCCWLVFRAGRNPCVQFSLWRPSASEAA